MMTPPKHFWTGLQKVTNVNDDDNEDHINNGFIMVFFWNFKRKNNISEMMELKKYVKIFSEANFGILLKNDGFDKNKVWRGEKTVQNEMHNAF